MTIPRTTLTLLASTPHLGRIDARRGRPAHIGTLDLINILILIVGSMLYNWHICSVHELNFSSTSSECRTLLSRYERIINLFFVLPFSL